MDLAAGSHAAVDAVDAVDAVVVVVRVRCGQRQRKHHVPRGHPGHGRWILVPVRRQRHAHEIVEEAGWAGPAWRQRWRRY